MFEGVIMPEIYLTDALGCNGKPMLAGAHGGFRGWFLPRWSRHRMCRAAPSSEY